MPLSIVTCATRLTANTYAAVRTSTSSSEASRPSLPPLRSAHIPSVCLFSRFIRDV
jgi:hypothetical protein